jgi:hypothetical protein
MTGRFLNGLALGLLIGFVISTGSLWLIGSTGGVVQEFFKDHLTHFFTLMAAGLALWGVSRQIQSNIELADHQRKAKLDAALSSLPIVLSNIHEMCEARCDAILRGRKTRPEDKHWEITDFELSTLRTCIEHAEGIEKELMQRIISDALFNYARREHSKPDRNEMRKSIFFTLRHINSGGLDGGGGFLLSNNPNYSNFLNHQILENHLEFLDDD